MVWRECGGVHGLANAGVGEAGRRLLQLAEILRLGRHEALIFMRGLPHAIRALRLMYFTEQVFDGLWDRWRSGAVAPLMIEHKPLILGHQQKV